MLTYARIVAVPMVVVCFFLEGHRRHVARQIDVFLGLADALAHPGEIDELHRPSRYSSTICFKPARK